MIFWNMPLLSLGVRGIKAFSTLLIIFSSMLSANEQISKAKNQRKVGKATKQYQPQL
jgi:hypothetical protein